MKCENLTFWIHSLGVKGYDFENQIFVKSKLGQIYYSKKISSSYKSSYYVN